MSEKPHKAGFVSIIGKPNVGKSTLMNVMVGERLSIITSKAQTTRHRIMGILNGDDFQIVYSDTPGIIQPKYELHQSMMRFVSASLEDADVILFVTDIYEKHDEEEIIKRLQNVEAKILLLINKIDQSTEPEVEEKVAYWQDKIKADRIIPISALENFNTDQVFNSILEYLPVHPPYYDKDELTDKPERFFAAEIIREKILLNYKKEIPYSCEVVVGEFKEDDTIIRMRAEIMVERKSQKGIVIGHEGKMLKKVGTQARQEMEQFFAKQVHLELYVRVQEDWRSNPKALNKFGYNDL
ncbi:GTPase Era [Adhaeribacter pallidiroseus]|uniref:GTPase Era n=1 Tax=Adhaeribacter pallidiroseus TaxID=2072847 RepID=A0A369QRK1_9BACT|nr:GTPase Era [Adhaeribacter pallidiroseus]RDC66295.1 GTPase Era [Adhaeribacter pallidiroseus]